jgi:phosphoribosylformylglycinamidine cyclo-ligase
VITGSAIKPGDVIIGMPSGGLQTNGFSLARKVIFDQCGLMHQDLVPGTRTTVSEALLAVHRSFLKPVTALLAKHIAIRGMAHITGGGFIDNIPRVLPDNCNAVIDRASWTPPMVFSFIERQGKVDRDEMYRVFNMGIGYVIVVRQADAKKTLDMLQSMKMGPVVVGKIEKGHRHVIYKN